MAKRRERIIAWLAAGLVAVYLCRLGLVLLHGAEGVVASMSGVAAQVPPPTQFVLNHRAWLPIIYGFAAIAVLVKEALLQDKRLGVMLTALVFIVFRIFADAVIETYYLPLFDLMRRLA